MGHDTYDAVGGEAAREGHYRQTFEARERAKLYQGSGRETAIGAGAVNTAAPSGPPLHVVFELLMQQRSRIAERAGILEGFANRVAGSTPERELSDRTEPGLPDAALDRIFFAISQIEAEISRLTSVTHRIDNLG